MPKTSARAANVPPSPIRKLVPFAEAAKKAGKKVYHINIGQPDIETPESFWKAIREYPSDVLAYGNARGIPSYVERLVKYYRGNNIDVTPDDIIVTTGGSEAIVFTMMTICDPGDEIVVFEPFYPNYNGYAAMAGIKLRPVTTDPEEGYHPPNAEIIEQAINERTRAILVCSPNNPTGTVLTRAELEAIAELANKHDLYVISDEVYREFIYEGAHTSVMHIPELRDRAIIMDSISKRFSICGGRIGCVVSKNADIIDNVWRMAQARLCPPTMSQIGARAVLENLTDDYFPTMKEEYKIRRDVTLEEIAKIDGAFCKKPAGAFYIMVKFPVDNIEDFAKWLLTDFESNGETTMIAPGPGFYATPGRGINEARLAYVLQERDMRRAVQILGEGIKVYKQR
ncbi:pyridoxal phosphate-dependent aminotransferase [bacterium]|nr:MAG: pyridoxal phosphate-dependent aminotransferase [bacterium]